jgi:hypothetical protein
MDVLILEAKIHRRQFSGDGTISIAKAFHSIGYMPSNQENEQDNPQCHAKRREEVSGREQNNYSSGHFFVQHAVAKIIDGSGTENRPSEKCAPSPLRQAVVRDS